MDRLKYTDKTEYDKNLIKDVIASIEKHSGKDCLSSIILTGSLGRGEPTYTVDEDGYLQLKSDVEIALIYPKDKAATEKLIRVVSAEFKEDLNLMAIDEKRVRKAYNFNYSFIVPKYKTIFTYDLFNGSKTIWGKNFIGEKHIAIEDCDIYEAKRLVANRIGELTYLHNTADELQKGYLRKQWKGKLVLAMVSAWLICEGSYVSSYQGQYNTMKKVQKKATEIIGEDFFADYDRVFKFLRKHGYEYEVKDEKLQEYVKNINKIFLEKSINKPKVNSFSHLIKYFAKYSKSGMNYGIFKFEDRILQALIDGYYMQKAELGKIADVWRRVLY